MRAAWLAAAACLNQIHVHDVTAMAAIVCDIWGR
jgi:hypothetical protein